MKSKDTLANKYRPRTLNDLVGQDHVTQQIAGMIAKEEISQTMLFVGPSGSGKTTLARMLTRYVNCAQLVDGHPCGECASCQRTNHPDVHELNMADTRGIDDVRDMIAKSQFSPQTNFRIFIVDEAHALTYQAQQAFLKPLEEPPKKTLWLLCTTNPEKFPETILQRCRIFELNALENKDCARVLKRVCKKEGIDFLDNATLKSIAALSENRPRRALKALEGVADYCQGSNKKLDNLEELLPNILKDLVSVPPSKLIARYLNSLYRGKYTGALLSIEQANDPDYFLRLVITGHKQVMYRQFSPKLQDLVRLDARFLYKELEALDYGFDVPHETMACILVDMVETVSELKKYQVDAKTLLIAMTVRLATLVKKGDAQ